MNAFDVLTRLSKLGKKSKIVDLGDVKIKLATLDSQQESDVFISCTDLTGNAYFYKLKAETLKYAIKEVDGERLDSYEDIKETDDKEKERKEAMKKDILIRLSKILNSWDENLISFLYSKWLELSNESEEELKAKGITSELTSN